MTDPRKRFTAAQAMAVADEIGLRFADVAFDLEQFHRGMEVELEHGSRDPATDVTNDDPMITGKIAWAHLREMPDYYDRLDAMEAEAEAEAGV